MRVCAEEKEEEFLEHRQRVTNMKQDLIRRVGEAKNLSPAAYLLRLAAQPVEGRQRLAAVVIEMSAFTQSALAR